MESWKPPKLGDLFPKKPEDEGAAKRFKDAGFDLHLTLQEQSPKRVGDKNHEGQQPRVFRRGNAMDPNAATSTTSTTTTSMPANILEQMEALRAAGATIGIPIFVELGEKTQKAIVELGEKTQKAMIAQKPSRGEELAMFSAKATIATAAGLAGAVAFWLITKPVEPGM